MAEGIHYSAKFEAYILGACLLEKSAFGRTYGLVDENSFYYKDNSTIYSVMKEMYNLSIPIDLNTVWQRIVENEVQLFVTIQMPGTKAVSLYLTNLTMEIVGTGSLEYYCEVVKKMWRKRELLTLTTKGLDEGQDERQAAYGLNNRINEILGGQVSQDWHSMEELMYGLLIHQGKILSGENKFVPTGFRGIDRENGGFSGGQLIVMGARPSVGKSALMGKMAVSMAQAGKTVGVVSLEMKNNEVAGRLASLETDIEFHKIFRALWDDQNQAERFYQHVTRKSSTLPVFVSDKTKVDVNEIKAKATKLKHQHGLDCLMIDYLQLVDSTENKNYNREQEVAKISRGLKLLAMDLDIPIMVLCQLNRAVTHRTAKDRYPRLQDLRESGAIEQDADVVMMLHRDYKSGYETDPETGSSTEFEADLLGLKWRNGATFHMKLDFEPTKMKFKEQPSFMPLPKELNTPQDEEELF